MIASATVFLGLAIWQAAVWIWVALLALVVPRIFSDPERSKPRGLFKVVTRLGLCFSQLYLVNFLRTLWDRQQSIPHFLLIVGCIAIFAFLASRWFLRGLRIIESEAPVE